MAKIKAKAKSCVTELSKVDKDFDTDKLLYNMEVDDSLYLLLGNPVKGKPNYKEHQKLYDGIREYMIETGVLTNFTHDPKLMQEQWKDFYDKKYINLFNEKSVPDFNKYRLKAMLKDFEMVKKQRAKALKKSPIKGISSISRAILPPDILAMRNDRYGFVSKIVSGTKNLSDKVKQSWNEYDRKISEVLDDYRRNMEDVYPSIDKSALMEGIRDNVDKNGDFYDIVGYREVNGQPQYSVKYKRYKKGFKDGKWVTGAFLGLTEQEYKKKFIQKYREDFINDLLHGQTRKVKWLPLSQAKKISPKQRAVIEQAKISETIRKTHADIAQIDDKIVYKKLALKDNNGNISWEGQIQYIMVKNDEGGALAVKGEEYNTYVMAVENIQDPGNWSNENQSDYKVAMSLLKDGYYRTEKSYELKHYQKKLSFEQMTNLGLVDKTGYVDNAKYTAWADKQNSNGQLYTEKPRQQWNDFEYMENQPDMKMVNKDLHSVVSKYRQVYKDVQKDITNFANKNEQNRGGIEVRITGELMRKGLTAEEAKEWMEENIFKWANISTLAKVDKYTGEVRTPDGYFRGKEQNYAPMMWHGEDYNAMVTQAMINLSKSIKAAKDINEDTKDMEEQLEHFKALASMDKSSDVNDKILDSASSVHFETRKTWTDMNLRRRNAQVHLDYLDKTYKNLHKNELLIDLMNQMYNVLKTDKDIPKGTIDYMVNRVKLAFGRDDVTSNVFGIETNNQKIADAINKFPSFIRFGRKWEAADAEKMWLRINGLLTMKFLGAAGAISNRTQQVNNIISYGLQNWWEAKSVMENDSNKWDKIIANTGVENLLSMFNDVMLQGGEVDWKDMGMLPFSDQMMKSWTGLDVPIPTSNLLNWNRVRKAGKTKFIQNPNKNIDETLITIIQRNQTIETQKNIDMARNLGSVLDAYRKGNLSDDMKTELQEKKNIYWELLELGENDQNEKMLQKKLSDLLGNVDDTLLKKMVTWKLSFWVKGAGESLFTFTKGEQQMRRETVVQALLVADQNKLLGSEPDRFMSPVAVKIGRDAVYQMMFGMSPVFLGEAFSGLGRAVAQYKSYPLFQTIKDHNTVTNMTRGGAGLENMGRLLQAAKTMMTEKNINNPNLDQDAIAFVRLIITRGMATGLSSVIQLIPFVSYQFFNTPFGSMLRAAENPLFASAYRTLLWGTMFGFGFFNADDEEKYAKEIGNKWMFLFTPTLLGYLARSGYDTIDKMRNSEGIFHYLD